MNETNELTREQKTRLLRAGVREFWGTDLTNAPLYRTLTEPCGITPTDEGDAIQHGLFWLI